MNDSANGLAKGLLIFGVVIIIGLIAGSVDSKPKCIKLGCSNDQASGSSYCYLHKPYTGSSSYSNKKVVAVLIQVAALQRVQHLLRVTKTPHQITDLRVIQQIKR